MSGIQQGIMVSQKITPVTYATWNPSDKYSNISLSNGNLTASWSENQWRGVRATIGKSSGKWYWELSLFTGSGTANHLDGVGNSSADLSSYVGINTNSWGVRPGNGDKVYNNSFTPFGSGFLTSDIMGIALDMDNGTLSIYRNNVLIGGTTTFTGITGTIYPISSCAAHINPSTRTVNFGATTMAYTAPAGFNQGLYN